MLGRVMCPAEGTLNRARRDRRALLSKLLLRERLERARCHSAVLGCAQSDGGEETMLVVVGHRPGRRRAAKCLSRLDVEPVMNAAIDPRQSRLDDLRVELRRLAREVVREYR